MIKPHSPQLDQTSIFGKVKHIVAKKTKRKGTKIYFLLRKTKQKRKRRKIIGEGKHIFCGGKKPRRKRRKIFEDGKYIFYICVMFVMFFLFVIFVIFYIIQVAKWIKDTSNQ